MELKVTGQGGQNSLNAQGSQMVSTQNNMEVATDVKNYDKKEGSYNEKDLQKAVNKLNNFLKDDSTHAEYSVHNKFNAVTVKIIDDVTKEVILEVPPKKILDMVAKMCELVGIVFDKRA